VLFTIFSGVDGKNAKYFVGVFFLFVLVSQIGSHLILDLHDHHEVEHFSTAFEHSPDEHEECSSDEVCGEEPRDDHDSSSVQDENHHFHILITNLTYRFLDDALIAGTVASPATHDVKRSLDPPYLPPQNV